MVSIFFMMTGFFYINFLVILPIGVIILYGTIIVDKYIMIRYSIPLDVKSIEYAMNFTKHLAWQETVFMTSLLGVMIKYILNGDNLGFPDT